MSKKTLGYLSEPSIYEIASVLVRLDDGATLYQRHDRENLPFSIHVHLATTTAITDITIVKQKCAA